MTSDNWLFVTVAALLGVTVYLIATRPELTLDDRKEMEEEWWG